MASKTANNDVKQNTSAPDAEIFAQNMAKAGEYFFAAMQQMVARQASELPQTPYDPFHLQGPLAQLWQQFLDDPARFTQQGLKLWQQYGELWQHTANQMMGESVAQASTHDNQDRRFADPAWQEHAVFDFLRQSYLMTSGWLRQTIHEAAGNLDSSTIKRLDFFTEQYISALSPSNFPATNPEVLRATLESNGENLVKGFANLLEDIQRGDGKLRIRMSDTESFKLGENLAATPGKVVYENELMQLIQYAPPTKTVFKTPLLIMPAWINKFYILDLQQKNSLAKWLVDQGHTVFMISWVNPDAALADKSFEDYMQAGPLAALDVIAKRTGEDAASIIGYCLGGTLLASTLAWLEAKGAASRVRSATFLATMVDFGDAGELSVFIDEAQIESVEARMQQTGYLDAADMAMVFNMLRANDLIWSFVVNQYLLGRDPFPFDLLYWNMDATRMPAAMHSYYLRNMYQKNLLAKPNGLKLCGEAIDLRSVTTPCYILSAREDHITPWQSTYAATQLYKGDKMFVLSSSGHVAGVVNPPAKNKYSYWAAPAKKRYPKRADNWLKAAQETQGSWWPHWQAWQESYAGDKVPARKIAKAIEDAPGRYVTVQA